MLTLRPIGDNDYLVLDDAPNGRRASVGRIREAKERAGFEPGWDWHIQVHIPGVNRNGRADTLAKAKADFKARWQEVRNGIGDEDFERAITAARAWVG